MAWYYIHTAGNRSIDIAVQRFMIYFNKYLTLSNRPGARILDYRKKSF